MNIYYQNLIDEILNQISKLKKLTFEQNRALLAEDIDSFLIIDKEKNKIKKVIDSKLKNFPKNCNVDKSITDKFNMLLKEISKIEQSNNNIIQSQLQGLLDEKKNINLNKKVTKIYRSTSMRYFNGTSSSSNLNKVL
ncbi:hypothetical protein LLG07_06845 [bacterium]|jgi:hypothetical protein|nr:hypothetical protein [bacterium]